MKRYSNPYNTAKTLRCTQGDVVIGGGGAKIINTLQTIQRVFEVIIIIINLVKPCEGLQI